MRAHLAVFFGLLFVSFASAETKFDFAGTPGKLPKDVVPKKYEVRIVPDVSQRTFTGSENVLLDVRQVVRQLVLNANELQISAAAIDDHPLAGKAFMLNRAEQTLTLNLPNELAAGEHRLTLKFHGKINPQGEGLFFAKYTEQTTKKEKTLLGTQFESTDARRMFPCWDEPSFRAQFQLTVVVPNEFTAVSNTPIESEEKIAAGREVRFTITPPMASYLLVFCAGEFDAIEGEQDGVKIRVVTTKGKGGQGRYALESAKKILHYYNEYFGVAFPLPKLDLIALPGGFGGAMENWGGITFFEAALLFDPQNSSLTTQQNVFAVVAHEMAHQWFGDLVTMAWWDNLWLNEGFASWMAAKCTDYFNPDWNEWLRRNVPRDASRRIGFRKDTAMRTDARLTTHPVQQPIKTEAEADSAFDEITYQKGESIIRMLESFLGADVFRDGIRKYISAHQYSNTTTADLWAALTDVSGKPINEIAPGWTEQPAFPVVEISRADDRVHLAQKRFAVHFPDPPRRHWQVPLTYLVAGSRETNSFLLRDAEADLPNDVPNDRAVKLNLGDAGYYRVAYDDASWRMLLAEVARLSEADRVNLLNDAWAMVEANRRPLAFYLDLAQRVLPNDQLAVYDQVTDTFAEIDSLLVGKPLRPQFRQVARGWLRPAFDRIRWQPKKDEPPGTMRLRATLVRSLGALGDADIIAACRAHFDQFSQEPSAIPPDLRATVFDVVGRYADDATWNKLHRLGLQTTSIEEKQNFFDALTRSADPALIRATLALALTDELPISRATALPATCARYGEHPVVVWEFAQAHMKALLAREDSLGLDRFAAGLFSFFDDKSEIAQLQTYAKSHLPKSALFAVAKASDEIGFRADFKEKLLPQVAAWLTAESQRSGIGAP